MKTSQKVLAVSAVFATTVFSVPAIAKTTKTATPVADPAVVEKQLSDEQKLEAYLGQGFRVCMNEASVEADISQMRQSGISEADAKKKIEEAVKEAPKEAQANLKKRFDSLVVDIYKNQPVQKTDAEKAHVVQVALFGTLYECAVDVGYSLAGGK